MSVWPFLMGLSGLVLALAIFSRNAPAVKVAGVIFAAYLAGRLVKASGIEYQVATFAMIWLCAAFGAFVADPRRYGISLILLGVSLCYVWARVTVAPWVFGSPPFVLSDLLAVLAMLVLGAGLRQDVIRRAGDMARRLSGRIFVSSSCRAKILQNKAGKKAG